MEAKHYKIHNEKNPDVRNFAGRGVSLDTAINNNADELKVFYGFYRVMSSVKRHLHATKAAGKCFAKFVTGHKAHTAGAHA